MADFIATPDFSTGDPEKGKVGFQKIGVCVDCHIWAGDSLTGRNPRSPAVGANLRATKLDQQGLYDVIRCGLPGTQMPYHDQTSYKDDRCYGLKMTDYDPVGASIKGHTLRDFQIVDIVAYLEKYMVGHGKPTYDECALYFDASVDTACSYLKGN